MKTKLGFCYGHRVHSAKDSPCRMMHGHQGELNILHDNLDGTNAFGALDVIANFVRDNIDHKFILDLNDPWFINITNLEPVWSSVVHPNPSPALTHFKPRVVLNTTDEPMLQATTVYVPGTKIIAGYKADVFELRGPERDFTEGFFFVTFVPTPDNLSLWIHRIIEEHTKSLNMRVSRVDWSETPKSST